MRHLKTPAGEVHELRFTPDGGTLYLLSNEPYRLHHPTPTLLSDGIRGIFEIPEDLFKDHLSSLFQRIYRIDARSAEITGNWSIGGSEVAAFTPDFRSVYHSVSVAVAGGELDLRRLDLSTGERIAVYDANVPYPSQVAFTPNGHILAIAGHHYSGDGRYCVHRLDVWHRRELDPIPFEARCLAYSSNGRFLATGNRMDGVRTWQGKNLAEQWAEPGTVLTWSPDDQLAWGMNDRFAVVRPGTGEALRTWSGVGGGLSALVFSPDSCHILAGTTSGRCTLHDAVACQQLAAFNWGIGRIHSVAFSPDGLTCAAGGDNGQIVVWDVDT